MSSDSEDEFYEAVARELQGNLVKPGLWTKAFAQADGETGKARALYIRYRVQELIQEKQQVIERSAEQQRAASIDQKTEQQHRRKEAEQREREKIDREMRQTWDTAWQSIIAEREQAERKSPPPCKKPWWKVW